MSRINEVDLCFSSMEGLDEGRINKLLMHHLANVARDCINRPMDKSARKVTLEFQVKPEPDPSTGDANTATVEIECKSKVPVYRSRRFEMRLKNNGLSFNQDFPDDLNQPSLFPDGEQEQTD